MRFGVLPVRTAPMGRPRRDSGTSGRSRRTSGSPVGYRPLYLVFRRPATAPPAPSMRFADGPPIELSFHFTVKLNLAERLGTIVQQAASLPTPQMAQRILARVRLVAVGRPIPTIPESAGSATSRFEDGASGSAGGRPLPVPASFVRSITSIWRRDRWAVRLVEDGARLDPVGLAGPVDPRPGPILAPGRGRSAEPSSRLNSPAHRRSRLVGRGLTPLLGLGHPTLGLAAVDPGVGPDHVISGPGQLVFRRWFEDQFAWSGPQRSAIGPMGSGRRGLLQDLAAGGDRRRQRRYEASIGRRQAGTPPQARHLLRAPAALMLAGVPPTWSGSPASTSRNELTPRVRPPVTRVHRIAQEAATSTAPTPVVKAGASEGSPAPAYQSIDLDRLDRDLWKRFEKRIRIEQERRGRR